MTVRARTTFTPWQETEMEQGEYDSLLRQGLIVLDAPGSEADENPVDEAPPAPAPRPQRGARAASPEASE